MSNIVSLKKKLDRLALQIPKPEGMREGDKWPPSLSWFSEDEQEHVKDLITRVAPRMKCYPDGRIDFDQVTENELREIAEVQEEVQRRSRGMG
jgi:hypothetical protein